MCLNKYVLPILSITVIKILNVSGFLQYRKCKINLEVMHHREINVNF